MHSLPTFGSTFGALSTMAAIHQARENARRERIAYSLDRAARTMSLVERKRELARLLRAKVGR